MKTTSSYQEPHIVIEYLGLCCNMNSSFFGSITYGHGYRTHPTFNMSAINVNILQWIVLKCCKNIMQDMINFEDKIPTSLGTYMFACINITTLNWPYVMIHVAKLAVCNVSSCKMRYSRPNITVTMSSFSHYMM